MSSRPTLDDLKEENEPGFTERERLEKGAPQMRDALREINQDVQWFFSCGGAISREDMMMIIRDVRRRVDKVRAIVWPPEPEDADPLPPLDNDF